MRWTGDAGRFALRVEERRMALQKGGRGTTEQKRQMMPAVVPALRLALPYDVFDPSAALRLDGDKARDAEAIVDLTYLSVDLRVCRYMAPDILVGVRNMLVRKGSDAESQLESKTQ
mmetsp:Transcript_16500/g.40638  ORF Transcript_16500/g.40638 Transcript_16500/m.40638 type:complete len:116 (+) Transcript_16500:1-348(+)